MRDQPLTVRDHVLIVDDDEDIRLTLTPHSDSCVIVPNSPEPDILTALVKLGGRATRQEWMRASGVSQSTWYRHVRKLVRKSAIVEDGENYHDDQRVNDAPLCGRESSPFELPPLHSRRQVAVSVQIGGQAEEHENRGDTEAVVPAINLCEQTAE